MKNSQRKLKTESTEQILDSDTRLNTDECWSVKVKRSDIELREFSRTLAGQLAFSSQSIFVASEALRKGIKSVTEAALSTVKREQSLNTHDEFGCAVLHYATRYNRVDAVRLMLHNGAEVDIRSLEDGCTPLHIASRFGWSEITKLLLNYDGNPKLQNFNGSTPLHLACRRGHKQIVSLLLALTHINIDAKDKSLMTPLHLAAIRGSGELCTMLIEKGADFTTRAADKMTPLHAAVANENTIAAHVILSKALHDVDLQEVNPKLKFLAHAQDIDSNTVLHLASLTNNMSIAETILDNGAKINACTANLSTPLHLACSKGTTPQMVMLLIEKGADINVKDNDGRTPLHNAALFNRTDVIPFLLDNGAEIDVRDFANRTPFLCAVAAGQTGSVMLLSAKGADINAYDARIKNCIHLAVENENLETLTAILEIEIFLENLYHPDLRERVPLHYAAMSSDIRILQAILCKQNRFAFQDESQKTPLHLACGTGRVDHAEALGNVSSSINDRDDEGRTPLHIAATFGHRKVCSKLVRLGADINIRDSNRRTPLMCAAKTGSLKTCIDLLANNAGINDTDIDGNSTLLLATSGGHVSVVKLLLDRGVNVTHRNSDGQAVVDAAVKVGALDVAKAVCDHARWREVLNNKDAKGHPPMKLLIQYFPSAAKLVMNRCISMPPQMIQSDPDYTVTYDFNALDPGPDDEASIKGDRYFGPLTMIAHNRKELLEHPLTRELLESKWSSFGKYIYYYSFYMYVSFMILFTYFLVTERSKLTILKSGNVTRHVPEGNTKTRYYLSMAIFIFIIMQIAKELFQLVAQGWLYFREVSNFLEWAIYISAMFFITQYINNDSIRYAIEMVPDRLTDIYVRWISGLISIFLCYMNLILFGRRFRIFGIYVTMFVQVMTTICKVMLVFIIFIIAFAVVFFISFKEQLPFQTLGHAIITVVVMMVGELEYVETFVTTSSEKNPLTTTSFVFCFLFIFMMSLALMNLLVGLAVGDIDSIQRDAVFKRLAMQVKYVAQIENKYPRFITRRVYKSSVVTHPNISTLKTRCINLFLMTKESPDKTATNGDYTVLVDNSLHVHTKLKKTQKQMKSLISVVETQNKLLKVLARKIDPSLDFISLSEETWIDSKNMNVDKSQNETEDFDGTVDNEHNTSL